MESSDFQGTPRFELIKRLGQGGMGAVYAVYDRERQTRVALKTLTTMSAERLLLLKKEFRARQDLSHPNLVHLGELFEHAGRWFFTMELVEGLDFLSYVRPDLEPSEGFDDHTTDMHGALPASRAAQVQIGSVFDETRLRNSLLQLSQGLCALHAARKVHRDIKPSNLLITAEGRLVILDFGIISDLTEHEDLDSSRALGTVYYMAPEQPSGSRVSAAADWYSVGVLLYLSLSGHLPFVGSFDEVQEQKRRSTPPPVHTQLPSVPHDLDRLCSDLLSIDPALRPTGAQIIERLQGRQVIASPTRPNAITASGMFVGRKQELSTLSQALADSRGETVTVLLHGESGVGKSALVRHFIEEQRRRASRMVALFGRCYEREQVPYKAVDSAIDQLSLYLSNLLPQEAKSLLPDTLPLLAQLFPVLEPLAALTAGTAAIADPVEARRQAFLALRQLLQRIASRGPLVLFIDDLQWADADSFVLLSEVLRAPDSPPLLLLATVRTTTSSDAERSLANLEKLSTVRRLSIEKLAEADARDLVARLLGSEVSDRDQAAAAIVKEAQGHPLFIDELVRMRRGTQENSEAAPLRLDEALWRRVQNLEAAARSLLEVVAVAGVPLPQKTAAQAAAITGSHYDALVAHLRMARLVRTAGSKDSDPIEAYHDRVRESIVARLPQEAQRSWHARLAVAIESSGKSDPEALVTHWQGAGHPERAAEYALRAADHASATLAFARAAALYLQAIELFKPTGKVRRDLLIKRAEALINAGHGRAAAELFVEAAEGADAEQASNLRQRAADQYLRSGHIDHGYNLIRQALRDVDVRYLESMPQVVASMLWHRLRLKVRGLEFKQRSDGEVPSRQRARIDALRSCAVGIGAVDPVRGAEFNLRCLLMALEVGEPSRIALGLCNEAVTTAIAGDPDNWKRGLELLERARALIKDSDLSFSKAMVTYSEGMIHHCCGHFRRAAELFDQAETLFVERCRGVTWEIATLRALTLSNAWFLGDLHAINVRLPQLLADAQARDDLYLDSWVGATSIPTLCLLEDQPDRSRQEGKDRLLRWPQRSVSVLQISTVSWKANSLIYEGKGVEAYRCLREEMPKDAKWILDYTQVMRIVNDELVGRTAVAAAMHESGSQRARLLQEADKHLRQLHKENRPWANAHASLLRASIDATRGDAASALHHLGRAEKEYAAAEMVVYSALAQRRRGALLQNDEGRALITAADELLRGLHMKNPERWMYMMTPAWPI